MRVIDTFEDFLTFWSYAKSRTLDRQIELWRTQYMAKFSELLEKQIQNYTRMGLDWHDIAKTRIFPRLEVHLASMREARNNILRYLGSVVS